MKLLLCFLFFLLCAGLASGQSASNGIYTIAEHMPAFPGGNDSLDAYMASHVIYPDDAIEQNIQGKVYVEFVIDTAGNVSHARIIRSVHPLLDSSAIAVVRYMPRWTPAEDGNHKVACYVRLPVIYHLEGDTAKETARSSKARRATHPHSKH